MDGRIREMCIRDRYLSCVCVCYSLLGCEEILRTVRKVCTYFSDIVRCLMKRKFLSVGKLIESEFRELEQAHTSYDNVDAYYNEVIHTFKMESLRFHVSIRQYVKEALVLPVYLYNVMKWQHCDTMIATIDKYYGLLYSIS